MNGYRSGVRGLEGIRGKGEGIKDVEGSVEGIKVVWSLLKRFRSHCKEHNEDN